ncbi:hypothetical protein TNCV_1528641 [Trichonephila clavipes]|nr:hypothetical protein TNCV_1528641 [Trichonephila clavipes]
MKQVSASEAQTQQHALNSSLRDIVDSSLVHQGGQLLNGSMSICPNTSLQPSFTSVIYGPWCTSFSKSPILDNPILPYTLYFHYVNSLQTLPFLKCFHLWPKSQ